MRILVVADLHLTNSSKDAYRWEIFKTLRESHKTWTSESLFDELVILGDLTEKKDNHPSKLVNRLVKELESICALGVSITILKGNHDYIEETEPFFEFLSANKNIKFISESVIDGRGFLFLPHSKTTVEKNYYDNFKRSNPNTNIECVFMHHTISSAELSDKFCLETADTLSLQKLTDSMNDVLVLSGDVHVPQTINNVIYIGAPYSIDNGDHWRGRAILLDTEQSLFKEIVFEESKCKWRFDVTNADDLNKLLRKNTILSNDSLLVRVNLDYVDSFNYESIKKEIKGMLDSKGIKSFIIRPKISNKKSSDDKDTVEYKEQLTPKSKLEAYAKVSGLQKPVIDAGISLLAD